MNEEQLNELWDQVKSEVDDVLNGVIDANEEVSPINILLKVDDSKHQIFAVLQIQRALRTRRICDAVGLYKAARDLWPDAAFGDYSNTVEQDIPALQEIYNMDLADIAVEYDDLMKTVYGANVADQEANAEEEHISVSDDEKSEDEEDQPKYKIAEINFDINDYIRNFTKPDVIHWYIFALNDFEMNSVELNRAIIKMLYRIAFQLEMPSKLYLASLFRILTKVNVEIQKLPKEAAKKHQFYDIYKLGYHLLQKFFGHFKERGPILICELLFSKNNRECTEIEHGYGTTDEQNNSTLLWTEQLEAEVEKLYHQYQSMEEKPEGISLIEYIQHNLAKERAPRQIQRQLKRMGFEFERAKKPRKPKVEGEKRKSRKSKKHINEDQLFASRTPSPSRSDSESEAESSANEDSGDEDNENRKSETPTEQIEIKSKPPKQKSPKKKCRSLLKQPIEAEPTNDNEPDENAMPSPSNHLQQSQHSLRRIVDSDDEMDNLPAENQDSNDGIVNKKIDKRRIIGSDDEEDIEGPISSQKKRQKIADEDDE
ncbi:Timeless protein region [Aphelenchoides bicaudatus]|nr:Timeless protein region [Aphelenchoides bicaudatus]